MRRPPYPARVAAGVLVTTLEESRKLPTRIITFPMTAVSRGLQAGMRLQQNIAEMAIKGDELFAPLCDKAEEQPAWAVFDEDEAPAESALAAPELEIPDLTPAPKPVSEKSAAEESAAAKPAAEKKPAAKKPAPKKPAPKKTTVTNGAETKTAGTAGESAPAAPSAASSAESTPAEAAQAGRFALYSSPPADLTPAPAATKTAAPAGPVPEIAEYLEYDSLTLAQLRTKLRGLESDDLQVLVDYERGNRNRVPFVTMIDNRITSVQKKSDAQ